MALRFGNLKAGLQEFTEWAAATTTACRLVEIGSFAGESAAIFAQYFNTVICIDPWLPETTEFIKDGTRDEVEARFNTMMVTNPNIVKLKGFAQDIVKWWDTPVDVVYIDGDHAYEAVKQDIQQWRGYVVKGGIIAGHDYGPERTKGVRQAVDELLGPLAAYFGDMTWAVRL